MLGIQKWKKAKPLSFKAFTTEQVECEETYQQYIWKSLQDFAWQVLNK
jgi:hypothetical protein